MVNGKLEIHFANSMSFYAFREVIRDLFDAKVFPKDFGYHFEDNTETECKVILCNIDALCPKCIKVRECVKTDPSGERLWSCPDCKSTSTTNSPVVR